jgi:hypothetical protein
MDLERLACCIRVNDSLDAGLSFFYAEVKRLKSILQTTETQEAPPVLFLIDEIFKGTNNRERLIGSRAYVRALATGNGYGLVTTHDLELADLDQSIPGLTNCHFQETVAAGTLQFDYQLRPGPCPTTNALRIMELEDSRQTSAFVTAGMGYQEADHCDDEIPAILRSKRRFLDLRMSCPIVMRTFVLHPDLPHDYSISASASRSFDRTVFRRL